MDLNSVRMFVAVVQAGSLSTAAERLGVPLPTLSRRIRELEAKLNARLFERHSQGVKVTEVGTRLYEHAARGIKSLEDAERAVLSDDEAQLEGILRLSIPPAFEPWWELIAAFQRQHRQVSVTVYTTERRVDLVEDGVDVALRVGDIVHEQMVARKLFSYRHVLVASPQLLSAFGTPAAPDGLRHFPCGVWRHNNGSNHVWRLGEQLFEPSAMLVTNDYLHLRTRAIAGDLVTELPPFLARDAVAEGKLRVLLPDYPLPMQDISLLYPSRRFVPSVVRAYINFCQDQVVEFCKGIK